jgi:uncharacterized protein YbaR (Trm112 family)
LLLSKRLKTDAFRRLYMTGLSKELLDVLTCPLCRSAFSYREKESKVVCRNNGCGKEFPVEDGIPLMLVEE